MAHGDESHDLIPLGESWAEGRSVAESYTETTEDGQSRTVTRGVSVSVTRGRPENDEKEPDPT